MKLRFKFVFTKPFPYALKTTRLSLQLLSRWIHIFRSLANLLAEESYLKAACERPIRKRATKITDNCMIMNQTRGLKEIWNRYKMPDHVTGHNFVTRHGYVIQNYSITAGKGERHWERGSLVASERGWNISCFSFYLQKKLNLKIKTDKSQKICRGSGFTSLPSREIIFVSQVT